MFLTFFTAIIVNLANNGKMALSFIAITILEYANMLEKQYSDMFFSGQAL